MKQTQSLFLFAWIVLCPLFLSTRVLAGQDPVVEAKETATPPVIDGQANDACWETATWQAIDQVWIPWSAPLDASDFSGRYKITWSSAENLLYFLVEITDDVVSDKYARGQTSDIYNFDMIEVFIDENKSGGYHVFDGGGNNESQLGTNAENAFAYHMFAKIPGIGESSTQYFVTDIAGSNWSTRTDPDNSSHLPSFCIARQSEHTWTYEFSLIVYNDSYTPQNKENSRVTLTKDKIMGLSLAANDDDQPDIDPAQTERDNMIGSVAVSQQAYNDHWKNADDFGTVKLVTNASEVKNWSRTLPIARYDRASGSIRIKTATGSPLTGDVQVYSLTGQAQTRGFRMMQQNSYEIPAGSLPGGLYVLRIRTDREKYSLKIEVL
ncbi:MAG TPA: sugar-binding protein [Prolixibacteraceae bacterium]|nr:sugar-binding protein [Prolixibacteraceae bacterium]